MEMDRHLNRLNDIPVSEHFRLYELECKGGRCCEYAVKVDFRLINLLELIRATVNDRAGTVVPIIIESGYRCARHNAAVGGVYRSFHTQGRAADLSAAGFSKRRLAEICRELAADDGFRVGFYWRHGPQGRYGVLHIDIPDRSHDLPKVFGDAWDDG